MSYLDVPRLHFAGKFFADPPTMNNTVASYNPAVTTPAPLWNSNGMHHFNFQGCTIRRAINNSGTVMQTASQDSMIGGTVAIASTIPAQPKLVDIDVEFQTASQIWGLELEVSNAGENFKATMETATLRDLWMNRAPGGFAKGFGGVYQSVLTGVTWNRKLGPVNSHVLSELNVASPTQLSIKFILYNYDATPGSQTFRTGNVVGTIGPVLPFENAAHFLAARRLEATGKNAATGSYGGAFGPAPFKVDAGRNKLIIDLGNAIPESTAGGARQVLGTMNAAIAPSTSLGSIDYSQAHYEATAGIEELSLTATQVTQLASNPLSVFVSGTALPTRPPRLVMSERPNGTYLDATEIVFRLNPGEEKTIEFVATRFGAPKSGQAIGLRLLPGRTTPGLTFPARVTTGVNGRASVKFRASDPGHPRTHIDGQIYIVAFDWGVAVAPAAPDQRGIIIVRVFDSHPSVAAPTWANVQPILEQYARLYPIMLPFVNLADHNDVRTKATQVAATLNYPETHPRYMPVSRDLSRDKKALILRWINRGAP